MLKKIILAGATASVIAVTSLTAMTGSAAAAPIYPQQYDNGYQGSYQGGGYQSGYQNGPNGNQAYDQDWFRHRDRDRDCRPVVRTVKWYDRFGFPHWRTVTVASRCDFRGPYPHPWWGH